MKSVTTFWLVLAVSIVLAGCAAERTAGVLPTTNASPFVRGLHKGRVEFRIRIPRKRARRPHYVSYSTKSIAITIDASTSPTILNVSSCSLSPTFSTCSAGMEVTAGHHTFTFKAYDKKNGAGNLLSANVNFPFTVTFGHVEQLKVVLDGIPASVAILPPSVPQVTGSQAAGFTQYGNVGQAYTVVPVDADGNYILGAGAPAVSMTAAPSTPVAVGTPSSSTSSSWTIASSYQASNPLDPATVTLRAVSSPAPGEGGSAVGASVNFSFYQPWIYVTNRDSEPPYAVTVLTEAGTTITLPASEDPFSDVPDPTGVAYDPQTQWVYVADEGGLICVYGILGNTLSGYTFANISEPQALAYAPSTSVTAGLLYVANLIDSSGSVTAYDGYANQQTLTPGITTSSPSGIAYDSHNGLIYVSDSVENTFEAYTLAGASQPLAATPSVTNPLGIAFDSSNDELYVTSGSMGTVLAYNENGDAVTLPTGAFAGLTSPNGIAYDPYNGDIYVVDNSLNELFTFNEQGTQVAPPILTVPASDGGGAWGVAIVP
ncbi:MAG TPA: hypothetical protein VMH02_12900 [Verrucomicrobiae bacterium]|nr:hypothetical protein [Verrucomicrobiae bacterium]